MFHGRLLGCLHFLSWVPWLLTVVAPHDFKCLTTTYLGDFHPFRCPTLTHCRCWYHFRFSPFTHWCGSDLFQVYYCHSLVRHCIIKGGPVPLIGIAPIIFQVSICLLSHVFLFTGVVFIFSNSIYFSYSVSSYVLYCISLEWFFIITCVLLLLTGITQLGLRCHTVAQFTFSMFWVSYFHSL